jgi:photosynthetic reaction center cytochrome c subunit
MSGMIRETRSTYILQHASLIAIGLSGALLIAAATVKAQSGSQPPTPSPSKTTEQVYKNIQILKGIPSDQLIPAMQFITSSLGVQCDFCHMAGAFEKDDKKPKQLARKMMQMMIIINQENFDSHREVTCNTCHRGSPRPVAIPVISADATPPLPQGLDEDQPPANLPSVDRILAKYVQAVGGMEAINKITSRTATGKITLGPRQFPVQIFDKSPNENAVVTHLPNGDNATIYNGQQGWSSTPGRPVRDMSSADAAAAALDADLQFPADANRVFKELKVTGEEKIGDKPTYIIAGAREGQPPTRLYFDQQSGLLVREVGYAETPLGLNPTQIDYADYRDQGGVKTPFQWTISQPRGRSTIQIEQMLLNVPIDDSKFAKPPAPAAIEKQ